MFPKFSVVVPRFRCQSPDGRHFAFNMGFFDNTEHGTCAELGEFSTHNPTHKMLDTVEVRSSSLLVPTISLYHLASLTSLRKAPNGSIKRRSGGDDVPHFLEPDFWPASLGVRPTLSFHRGATQLLQLCILSFGLLEDRNLWVPHFSTAPRNPAG